MKRYLCLFGVAALLLVAADDRDEAKKEIERFEGTWTYVSLEIEGNKAPQDSYKGAKLVIKGDKFTAHQGEEVLHGTFKVDTSKKPKTIDVTFSDGPDKGKIMRGIYELDNDTYKVCIAMPGKDRPAKFETKKDSGHVLEVLKREKK
jgi:uncharacterized protein (TIGR03067 family)